MPKGIARVMITPTYAWRFPIEDSGTASPEVWRRGRVLGGSSSINGMIYSRGHALDYEDWKSAAGEQWGWESMKAVYRTIEDHDLGPTDYRGSGGPLHISSGKFRYPLAEAMIEAGEEMGLPRRDELNHPDLEGVGYYSHTIKAGRRVSSAAAFLRPIRHRRNLTVKTRALVTKVAFDGEQARHVHARVDGRATSFRADREIIISGGTIMSPQILQLSGIGPADRLRSVGVPVVHDSPAVGENMLEHVCISLPHRLVGQSGLNRQYRGIGLLPGLARYLAFHDGAMATGPFEVGAFARSGDDADRPDLQLYLSAYSRISGSYKPEKVPGMTIYGQMLRATSTGWVRIASPDPEASPSIQPNWLSTRHDQDRAVAMVRYMREYVQQKALKTVVGQELAPGEEYQTYEEILAVFRRTLTSGLHAVGTCAMGTDPASVVDGELRVRGVSGLRVADCSVMPGLISGNTNGPAMALGWKAADLILGVGR
jgi:choline dehydrogenase-like flavoprotein